jgi:hypothetical protein
LSPPTQLLIKADNGALRVSEQKSRKKPEQPPKSPPIVKLLARQVVISAC